MLQRLFRIWKTFLFFQFLVFFRGILLEVVFLKKIRESMAKPRQSSAQELRFEIAKQRFNSTNSAYNRFNSSSLKLDSEWTSDFVLF